MSAMLWSAAVLIHVCGATVGLLSGYLSMVLRKGSGLHRVAGTFFFGSMLTMAAGGAYMAFVQTHMMNFLTTGLTAYLVVTGWLAGRRREGTTGMIDLAALLFVLAVGIGQVTYGLEAANAPTRSLGGYPATLYFVFGSISLLHALADIRMLIRRGVSGTRRIARHLWRMSLALLFASLSLYPGQARLFPASWRETNLLYVPHVLLFGAMLFWVARMRSRRREPRELLVAGDWLSGAGRVPAPRSTTPNQPLATSNTF